MRWELTVIVATLAFDSVPAGMLAPRAWLDRFVVGIGVPFHWTVAVGPKLCPVIRMLGLPDSTWSCLRPCSSRYGAAVRPSVQLLSRSLHSDWMM